VGYAGGVGPDVRGNPPQIIVGGRADAAFRRAAEFGDGWMLGGSAPERFPELSKKLGAAWRRRGRQGEPRKMALTYFALGDDPEGDARRSIGDYYSSSAGYAEAVVAVTAKGERGVRERLENFREMGVDEVVMFPASPDPEQVDFLARVAL
jgi:alkanesulfonate monooxygenase SsuD/methylene tetrahydromethanopterin reductase-like flavin-dependent oxidoreductase (luciferase family)